MSLSEFDTERDKPKSSGEIIPVSYGGSEIVYATNIQTKSNGQTRISIHRPVIRESSSGAAFFHMRIEIEQIRKGCTYTFSDELKINVTGAGFTQGQERLQATATRHTVEGPHADAAFHKDYYEYQGVKSALAGFANRNSEVNFSQLAKVVEEILQDFLKQPNVIAINTHYGIHGLGVLQRGGVGRLLTNPGEE
ncbi:MAG: hypothetical protein AAB739_03120 [Patescibacteria group bacterium]